MTTPRRPCPPAPGPLEAYAARFDPLLASLAQRRGLQDYLPSHPVCLQIPPSAAERRWLPASNCLSGDHELRSEERVRVVEGAACDEIGELGQERCGGG